MALRRWFYFIFPNIKLELLFEVGSINIRDVINPTLTQRALEK